MNDARKFRVRGGMQGMIHRGGRRRSAHGGGAGQLCARGLLDPDVQPSPGIEPPPVEERTVQEICDMYTNASGKLDKEEFIVAACSRSS